MVSGIESNLDWSIVEAGMVVNMSDQVVRGRTEEVVARGLRFRLVISPKSSVMRH